MKEREKQNIDLKHSYDWIVFIGGDASWDSFEPGKGFHNIYSLTDSVEVLVNEKDTPLKMSRIFNLKRRIGQKGPRKINEVPGYILITDMTNILVEEDKAGMGHDYFLRNPHIRDALVRYQMGIKDPPDAKIKY